MWTEVRTSKLRQAMLVNHNCEVYLQQELLHFKKNAVNGAAEVIILLVPSFERIIWQVRRRIARTHERSRLTGKRKNLPMALLLRCPAGSSMCAICLTTYLFFGENRALG